MEPGPADRAYGIHVAQLAGVPSSVVKRAQTLLQGLEQNAQRVSPSQHAETLPLLALATSDPLDEMLRAWLRDFEKLEINSLTPLEALVKLHQWQTQFQIQPKGDTRNETTS